MDKFGRFLIRKNVTLTELKLFDISRHEHYNFCNKRLCNIHTTQENFDCLNKKYVDDMFEALSNRVREELHSIIT